MTTHDTSTRMHPTTFGSSTTASSRPSRRESSRDRRPASDYTATATMPPPPIHVQGDTRPTIVGGYGDSAPLRRHRTPPPPPMSASNTSRTSLAPPSSGPLPSSDQQHTFYAQPPPPPPPPHMQPPPPQPWINESVFSQEIDRIIDTHRFENRADGAEIRWSVNEQTRLTEVASHLKAASRLLFSAMSCPSQAPPIAFYSLSRSDLPHSQVTFTGSPYHVERYNPHRGPVSTPSHFPDHPGRIPSSPPPPPPHRDYLEESYTEDDDSTTGSLTPATERGPTHPPPSHASQHIISAEISRRLASGPGGLTVRAATEDDWQKAGMDGTLVGRENNNRQQPSTYPTANATSTQGYPPRRALPPPPPPRSPAVEPYSVSDALFSTQSDVMDLKDMLQYQVSNMAEFKEEMQKMSRRIDELSVSGSVAGYAGSQHESRRYD
ncbi:hypothetical protein IAT38_002514 [Cryptococcus sp. DSM 104549]